jgi:thiosulfate dehydrogenase (quinone) large subunit
MERSRTFLMTRERTWMLTAVAVVVFVLLSWIFADGLLVGPLWNGEDWMSSPLITYLMIVLIVAAGWYQAQRIPAEGIPLRFGSAPMTPGQVDDPIRWQLVMGNIFFAIFWLPIRFFVGREWFSAGVHKVTDPAWTDGGAAVRGFWERAVTIPAEGRPPITYDWYRQFLQYMLDNNWNAFFGPLIAWGEVLVGVGLLVGALVGIAAFFGTVMNVSFMLAGTASSNPVLFGIGVFLVLAWKVAGFWGLDRWLLPALGTPWDRVAARPDSGPAGVAPGRAS